MEIIKLNDKNEIRIAPLFFTAISEKSAVMAFYSEDEKGKLSLKEFAKDLFHSLLFRSQADKKVDADLWEVFLEEFLFTFYCDEYQIVVYTGIDITEKLEKCQTKHFIFQKEYHPTVNEGVYFSIKENKHLTFRNMALFDFYWALNDYTILIFSKEFIVDNQTLHYIANNQYNQALLMAEIQIGEDGQLVECIYQQEIHPIIHRALDSALLKIKEHM